MGKSRGERDRTSFVDSLILSGSLDSQIFFSKISDESVKFCGPSNTESLKTSKPNKRGIFVKRISKSSLVYLLNSRGLGFLFYEIIVVFYKQKDGNSTTQRQTLQIQNLLRRAVS